MMIGIDGAINMALFIFVLYQFITYSLDISWKLFQHYKQTGENSS